MPDQLARLLAQEKEEGAEEGAHKVKEDWGNVDEEASVGSSRRRLRSRWAFFVWLFRAVFKWVM